MNENEKKYSVSDITGLLDISVASLSIYGKRLDLEPHYSKDGKRKRFYSQGDFEQLKQFIESK